ncbi:MAG TPA: trypsin-like peptidase domain-containing protein [Burkholderiaceae bacterium]|nr:trypsin-like peptidase domain-containing protein [Burkholderiaceae bacterium]
MTDDELDGLGFSAQDLMSRTTPILARPLSSGVASGFLIGSDGQIVTNAHVVADTASVTVRLRDGRQFRGRVLGLDKRTDVAVLKIEASGLHAAAIGNSADLVAGEWVFAVGSPLGLEGSVTAGIVSAPRRTLPGSGGVPLIQTDVAVNPGSSGGPLFNQRGEVVGMNTLIYSANGGFMGISLAVPIDVAIAIANELRLNGRVRRGELGAMIQELTPELAQSFGRADARGALVTRVVWRSAAERAGLRSGDILLGIDDRIDLTYLELQQLVAGTRAGTRLSLNVWRGNALQQVTVVAREAKADLPAEPVDADRRVPRLGLQLVEVSEQRSRALRIEGGLQVVRARGAAARGGVVPYDIVVAIGAQPVRTLGELDLALSTQVATGKPVALLVLRDGRFRYLPVSQFE